MTVMATWRNTTYRADAILQSPDESVSRDGARTRRIIYVTGRYRQQAELDFVGYPNIVGTLNVPNTIQVGNPLVSYISRVTPHAYQPFYKILRGNPVDGQPPFDPENPPLPNPSQPPPVFTGQFRYCRSVINTATHTLPQGQSWADPFNIATGDQEKMTLEYNSLDYEIREDQDGLVVGSQKVFGRFNLNPLFGLPDESQGGRYISRYFQDAGRFFIPGKSFMYYVGNSAAAIANNIAFWNDQSQVIPEGEAIYEPRTRLTYVWHEVPISAMPWTALTQFEGCVNLLPFDPYWFPPNGLYPQTVLYTGWDAKQSRSVDGQIVFDVYLKFTYIPNVDFGSVVPSRVGLADGQATCMNTYTLGPIPRGPNWRLRQLTVPFVNTNVGGSPINPNIPAGVTIGFDYRPIFSASRNQDGDWVWGNQPYKAIDLGALFRPPINVPVPGTPQVLIKA